MLADQLDLLGDMPGLVLWRYDLGKDGYGILHLCPKCKRMVDRHVFFDEVKCRKCGQLLNWNDEVQYKGKVNWE